MAEQKIIEHKNVHEAIAAVMADVGYVQKDKAKEGGIRYAIKSEEGVLTAVRPALLVHGLNIYPGEIKNIEHSTFTSTRADGKETVWNRVVGTFIYVIFHAPSGTFVEVQLLGEGADTGDKAVYKAMTGSKKYAILEAFLLVTGDDPEETASPERPAEAKRPYPAPILVDKLQKGSLYFAKKAPDGMTAQQREKVSNDLLSLTGDIEGFVTKVFNLGVAEMKDNHWMAIGNWLEVEPQYAKPEAAAVLKGA